jgi:hypothetical protein
MISATHHRGTRLRMMRIPGLKHETPVCSLPQLRKLHIPQWQNGFLGDLVDGLQNGNCAGALQDFPTISSNAMSMAPRRVESGAAVA